MKYRKIEIDFEIHQLIEMERRSFDEPENAALRRLLNLDDAKRSDDSEASADRRLAERLEQTLNSETGGEGRPFIEDGVVIPSGTLARMSYLRGAQRYEGRFIDGNLKVGNETFTSFSSAARSLAVTKDGSKTSLNGWLYWEVKKPGSTKWERVWDLRESVRGRK